MGTPLYLAIINPKAGPPKDLRRIQALLENRCALAGVNLVVEKTHYRGHATALVQRYGQSVARVIGVGGDGTLREIVAGLVPGIPLALVPLGTVNVLAKDLGIPEDPPHSIDLALNGVVRYIDVAYLRDEPFLLMASAGIDALTVHNLHGPAKRLFGQFAYVLSSLRTAAIRKPERYKVGIYLNGQSTVLWEKGYLVLVSNARYYAGRHTIIPGAGLETGKLHVMVYRKPGAIDTLQLIFNILAHQQLHLKDVGFYEADEVTIEGRKKPPRMQYDGDKAPRGPVRITLRPGQLPVLVPENQTREKTSLENILYWLGLESGLKPSGGSSK
ncbi:MAG: diacylglycerol kinase family lipid kinase [Spirochaetales bacterium]|nr:diacylglycerol kinase family lipid kinase [Spirochaetales bacterium]